MRFRVAARVGALGVLAAAAAGCWLQPGSDAGNTKANAVESALTAANVASREEAWSGRGNVSAVTAGKVIGVTETLADVEVVAHDVRTGAEVWSTTLTPPGAAGFATYDPVVTGAEVWVGYQSGTAAGGCAVGLAQLDLATGAILGRDTSSAPTEMRAFGDRMAIATSAYRPSPWGDPWCMEATPGPLRVVDVATGAAAWSTWSAEQDPVVVDDVLVTEVGGELRGYPVAGCGSARCWPAWSYRTPVGGGDKLAVGTTWLAAYVPATHDGSSPAVVTIVDAHTGAEVVAGSRAPDQPRSLALADVGGTRQTLALGEGSLQANATTTCGPGSCPVLWSATLGGPASPIADLAVAGGVAYVPRDDGVVEAYDIAACAAAGGACTPAAEVSVGGSISSLAVAEGRLVVSGGNTVTAFAPAEPA